MVYLLIQRIWKFVQIIVDMLTRVSYLIFPFLIFPFHRVVVMFIRCYRDKRSPDHRDSPETIPSAPQTGTEISEAKMSTNIPGL